ncbi:unnamed protein product [Urochloa humidicola]
MDPEIAAAAAGPAADRLSDLPDGILGHILSFLQTKEAGRTMVLSCRWLDIFASVHTLSFEQPEAKPFKGCESCYYGAISEKLSTNWHFLNDVSAALLFRRRSAGPLDPPLRAFRVAFDDYHCWDAVMVDLWLTHVIQHGGELRRLELRLVGRRGICDDYWYRYVVSKREARMYNEVDDSSEDEDNVDLPKFIFDPDYADDEPDEDYPIWPRRKDMYVVPNKLYSCVALRTLCIGPCLLNLPAAITLPSVETLLLTQIIDSDSDISRLISSCPLLHDLTLEGCNRLRAISVLDKHLHRFAITCCHNLERVTIDASELRCFEYKGSVPVPSLFALHGLQRVSSCRIEFCGEEHLSIIGQFVWFKKLLKMFTDTCRHLHLQSVRLGCGMDDHVFRRLPTFCSLQHLELTGVLQEHTIVDAVIRIIERAPKLEALSLFIMPASRSSEPGEYLFAEPDISVCCLQEHIREIKVEHYQGSKAQRRLLKFLLGNALVLEKLSCVFANQILFLQIDEMMNEIQDWAVNKSVKMKFV